MTLKDGKPYSLWNIVSLAHHATQGVLILKTTCPFHADQYPGNIIAQHDCKHGIVVVVLELKMLKDSCVCLHLPGEPCCPIEYDNVMMTIKTMCSSCSCSTTLRQWQCLCHVLVPCACAAAADQHAFTFLRHNYLVFALDRLKVRDKFLGAHCLLTVGSQYHVYTYSLQCRKCKPYNLLLQVTATGERLVLKRAFPLRTMKR